MASALADFVETMIAYKVDLTKTLVLDHKHLPAILDAEKKLQAELAQIKPLVSRLDELEASKASY